MFQNIVHTKFSDIFISCILVGITIILKIYVLYYFNYTLFQQYNLKLVNNIINIIQPYKIN